MVKRKLFCCFTVCGGLTTGLSHWTDLEWAAVPWCLEAYSSNYIWRKEWERKIITCSMLLGHVTRTSYIFFCFPRAKDVQHEFWLQSAQWFLRKKCLKVWMDDSLKARADNLWGKNDANRKTVSLYPFVVSFKHVSLNFDFQMLKRKWTKLTSL